MPDQNSAVPDLLRDLLREIRRFRSTVNAVHGKQLQAAQPKERAKEIAQTYFHVVRPPLVKLGVATEDGDSYMQQLIELANRNSSIARYKTTLNAMAAELGQLEVMSEKELSDVAARGRKPEGSPIEKQIALTLAGLLPTTALSYEQVLLDLQGPDRVSYRGTATELREILRETLDHLSPDKEVVAAQGFQLEKDRTRPTMAQKAKYILRLRGLPKNSIDVPRKAIEIVEDTVSSLVRSTYDRGSIDTHTAHGITKANAIQLKMYVDSVLCELLEIHNRR